ncbi:glycine/sarcosine/betaine reductase complex component C subunit alpha [Escherichia fergusonii]|uniref:Glycine reductase n=1 Tax=Escherichia fergusonii TaxID=564 RepID=A0A7W3EKS4_ESCFE|nr:glycine/sarcosine/betaine reductase complex component C subunit alpha [Escherichia fergusonii]EHG6165060.1 glycine reductase [Escherichia fergusonii]EHG7565334.1 glycine reductase [Escherichia fergusonii]MBA8234301.1 glycine reductase [Escherichia fergusonii]MBA8241920.1 glycine reductase [Escherichia fergusonii]QLM09533.1 glycine reductase [Escherichia fergusonii]
MAEHPVAKTLRGLADALSGAPPRLKIAFTALGSEFSTDVLLSAAEQVADRLLPVIIGPKPIPGFPWYQADELASAHRIMEQLLADGEVAGAVTLHYNFPLGVATVAQIHSIATGRSMVLASTTGTSDVHRPAAMVKNAIAGVAMAEALGIEEPRVGILNVDDASTVQRLLARLREAGFPLHFAQSSRADGGALMRGNDLIRATSDVLVCDTLTGNLLIKLFSAGLSGGEMETMGSGYGIGLGPDQKAIIGIISRASGPATISQALCYCAQMARNDLMRHWQKCWQLASSCGIEEIVHQRTPSAGPSTTIAVSAPPKTVLDDEIHGIDILRLEEACQHLWRHGIYAETGMGCTGPVLMINRQQRADADQHLKSFLS